MTGQFLVGSGGGAAAPPQRRQLFRRTPRPGGTAAAAPPAKRRAVTPPSGSTTGLAAPQPPYAFNRAAYGFASLGLLASAAGATSSYRHLASMGPLRLLGIAAQMGASRLARHAGAADATPGFWRTTLWLGTAACRGAVLGALSAGVLFATPTWLVGCAVLCSVATGIVMAGAGGQDNPHSPWHVPLPTPRPWKLLALKGAWLAVTALAMWSGDGGTALFFTLALLAANHFLQQPDATSFAWQSWHVAAAAGGIDLLGIGRTVAPALLGLGAMHAYRHIPQRRQELHQRPDRQALCGAEGLLGDALRLFSIASLIGVCWGFGRPG